MSPRRLAAGIVGLGGLLALLAAAARCPGSAPESAHATAPGAPHQGPHERPGRTARTHNRAPLVTEQIAPTAPVRVGPDGGAREMFRVGWGGGDGDLGRASPEGAAPEGPMSFTVDAQGNLVVLDQVNRRLVRYAPDGRLLGSTPLDDASGEDVALGRDGTAAVMDRRGARQVSVLGPDGRRRGALPLEGPELAQASEATGVVVDGDGVYVEREHGPLLRVGDTAGRPDGERGEIPGRPTRDGRSYVSAMLIEGPDGRFVVNAWDRPSQAHRFSRAYATGTPLDALLLADTDRAGVIYVAVRVVQPAEHEAADAHDHQAEGEEGHDHALRTTVRLFCLEPAQGQLLGQATVPGNDGPEDAFRELAVLDEGGVVYATRSEQGVAFQRVECQ